MPLSDQVLVNIAIQVTLGGGTGSGGGGGGGAPAVTPRVVNETLSPYTAQPTDDVILVDNSATGNQIRIFFEATPIPGTRHTVRWWAWPSDSAPGAPPLINPNGNQLESANNSKGKVSATVTTCTIANPGGSATWEWVGAVPGGLPAVNAWVLIA